MVVEKRIAGQRNMIAGRKGLLWITRPFFPGMWGVIQEHVPTPKVVVELGSNVGRWASEVLRRFSSIEKLFAVDLWPHPAQMEGWRENVADRRAVPIRGRTDAGETLARVLIYGTIDILFVDAAHDYESALRDLLLYAPRVRPGGLILADDYHEVDVRRAVATFLASVDRVGKGHAEHWGGGPDDVGDQWWVVKDW